LETGFATVVGYILGVLIVLVLSGICLKPIKTLIKFLINSALGLGIALVINFIGSFWGIHIGINPFSAIALGLFGVPGIIMILIAQIFY